MIEFKDIANSEGAKIIYQKVVDAIKAPTHPAFLTRPIKVLDLGGGNGNVGLLLQQQCETILGPLSGDDFGSVIDYVNVDLDSGALAQSPGRTLHTDISQSYAKLHSEDPFDFVLSINPSPATHRYTTRELDRIGIPDDMFNPIRGILLGSAEQMRNYLARITLISAASLLQGDGRYIWSGFIGNNSLEGTAHFIRQSNLGLRVERNEQVNLDEMVRKLFVKIDTEKKRGKAFEKLMTLYSTYRLVVMRIKGLQDKVGLVATLDKEVNEYRELSSYCEAQERFGRW